MDRIAALSLTVVSLILLNSPADPASAGWINRITNLGGRGAKEGAEHIDEAKRLPSIVNKTPNQMLEEGANGADAVKGLPDEVAPATGNTTPNQMLETGAQEAGLDPENAIQGAPQPLEADVNPPGEAINVPAPSPATVVGATARSVSDEGTGAALPIAGGAALAVTYGIYRAVKGRR